MSSPLSQIYTSGARHVYALVVKHGSLTFNDLAALTGMHSYSLDQHTRHLVARGFLRVDWSKDYKATYSI